MNERSGTRSSSERVNLAAIEILYVTGVPLALRGGEMATQICRSWSVTDCRS